MADRPINRDAWATLVAKLVEEEAGGNKSEFGRMVKVQYQTVRRWLDAQNDVSEESVRSVARALNLRPMDLLVKVGYYDRHEVPVDVAEPQPDGDEEAVKLIEDAKVTPAVKRDLKKWLHDQRVLDAQRRVEDLRRMLARETRRTA